MAVQHDAVTQTLATQIDEGIAKINEANEILLASESAETGNREIDKAFKDGKVENKKAVSAWEKAEKAREQYRSFLNEARNTYRVEVLGVEESVESEVDEDAVKEIRKMVLEALKLAQTYATANKNQSVLEWAQSVSVPQVGRKGSATVGGGGSKKPRVYVKFNENTYNSFGEAAKALSDVFSTDDNKVSVSSPDLVQAWSDANEAETFEFSGVSLTVVPKQKAAA